MSTNRQGAYPQMPRQKLSARQKNDKWREANVDAIDGMATSTSFDGRASKVRKQVNYDLVNSKIDEKNYNYVTDSFGYGEKYGKAPARLRCINVVKNKVEKLKGDEIQRPFDFSVMCVGGEGVSAKDEKKKKVLLKTAAFIIRQEAGITEEGEEEENFPTLAAAAQSFVSYADIRERYASAIIRNGYHDQRFDSKFSTGFEHGLISGEEIYYTGIVANEPVLRVVNPIYFEWDKGPETDSIEDASWCREERYMSVAEIMDEFSEFLTESEVKNLDDGSTLFSASRNTMLPGYAYSMQNMNAYDNYSGAQSNSSFIRVVTACWKSMKKIGFLIYFGPDGEQEETIVEEDYVLSEEAKKQGAYIEWRWINEVWKGTKIGDNVYVDINPIANQMRTMDNPSECKLPYVGKTYNNLNSTTTSFVDLIKPHQYLINVVWYRIEEEIAKAKGKKVIMDLAQLPTTHGLSMEKWMYYFDNLGIMYINSMEEGKAGTRMQGQQSAFNQFKEIDLSLSNVVQQYMMILAKLEQLIDSVSGVSRQSEGNTSQYETASGIQASVAQSSTITEYYFFIHDEVKREALRQFIEVSKYAYAGGKKISYITSDLERISMEVNGEMFIDSDYNVFPTNANKDKLVKAKVEQLAPMALQQDKANLSDMVNLLKTDSISEFEHKLIQGEQAKAQRDKEMQEMQERINQQNIEARKEADERNHQQDIELATIKGELDIRKAIVTAQGFDTDKDRNNNDIPDVVEVGQDQIEGLKSHTAKMNAKRDRAFQAEENKKDRELEREKLQSKEKIEKAKNKTALKNKVVGEK